MRAGTVLERGLQVKGCVGRAGQVPISPHHAAPSPLCAGHSGTGDARPPSAHPCSPPGRGSCVWGLRGLGAWVRWWRLGVARGQGAVCGVAPATQAGGKPATQRAGGLTPRHIAVLKCTIFIPKTARSGSNRCRGGANSCEQSGWASAPATKLSCVKAGTLHQMQMTKQNNAHLLID